MQNMMEKEYYHSNGNRYDGDFHDKFMEGFGVMYYKNGIDMKDNLRKIKKKEKEKNFS